MASAQEIFERSQNPVDVVERLASVHDWVFDRSAEDEINISVGGAWSDYHVSFTWRDDLEALHLACAFHVRVPLARRDEMHRLIILINERLWLGHFDLWFQDGVLMYRHGFLLAGGAVPTARQCEAMLQTALDTCESYYQSFQFVSWAGKTADGALELSLLETAGQA